MKKLLAGAALLAAVNATAQPLMGWSSWNTYRVNINDRLIRSQADAMVSLGLDKLGYNYINIDDGFFGYRDSLGVMHTHPERFPDGLKGTADYIHSKGLKAGIYSDAGYITCGSIYDNDPNGIGAGLYGYEKQDADLYFNQWGFDFIKIDYCGAGTELKLDEQQRYTEICKAITSTAKRPVRINLCRWAFPGTWAADIAGSWRISPDIRPKWTSVKRIIEKNMFLSEYASYGHYNDMDMLEVGRGMKPNEDVTHFAMWCILSSPLLIGCDLNKIKPEPLKLISNPELIALNQDKLGLQAKVVAVCDSGYVFAKDIETLNGTKRAVALYNPTDRNCHFDISPAQLLLGGKITARDLIERKDLGKIRGNIVKDVPAHSTVVLMLNATERIEQTVYEAEHAYLPLYNDLEKSKKPVSYIDITGASCMHGITNVGGSKENCAQWNSVYSKNGGDYEMTVVYKPRKSTRLEIDVNGKTQKFYNLPDEGELTKLTLKIHLKKGNNTIKMGSPLTWTPDLDCFILKKF